MRVRLICASVVAGLLALAAPAAAGAITRVVAPGSTRTSDPCTRPAPCALVPAIERSKDGDIVSMRPGQYNFSGASNKYLSIGKGVTLQGSPGAPRPLIKQTSAFPTCNCPTLFVLGVVRDVAVDQSVGGAGAIGADASAIVERTVLTGRSGLYFVDVAPKPAPQGSLRDSLVVASNGDAIFAQASATYYVENVTAIAHGNTAALRAWDPATLRVLNTIARGDTYDVQAESINGGAAKVTLENSNYRSTNTYTSGAATIGGSHNQGATPLFASPTNYHERPGSPTINAGTSSGLAGTLDLSGLPRNLGSAPDIGAFEFPPPFLGVSIAQKATVAGGKAKVRLTCPPPTAGRCGGKLTLRRKSDETKLGTSAFSIARGTTVTVKVALPDKLNKALAKGESVQAIARTVAHDAAGQARTRGRQLTLKL
jgi:hypothetical protein